MKKAIVAAFALTATVSAIGQTNTTPTDDLHSALSQGSAACDVIKRTSTRDEVSDNTKAECAAIDIWALYLTEGLRKIGDLEVKMKVQDHIDIVHTDIAWFTAKEVTR